jgi:hypothetical protein
MKTPFILSVLILSLISCSQSIKIYENDKFVMEITDLPKTDTTIQIRDYFITYKLNKPYIEGFVENNFDENKGSFKSTGTVEIEIGVGKFMISN